MNVITFAARRYGWNNLFQLFPGIQMLGSCHLFLLCARFIWGIVVYNYSLALLSRHAKDPLGTLRGIIHLVTYSCIFFISINIFVGIGDKAATHPIGLQRLIFHSFISPYSYVIAKFTTIEFGIHFTCVRCMLISLCDPLISVWLTRDTILLCIYLLNLFIKLIFLIDLQVQIVRQSFIGGLSRIYDNTFIGHFIKYRNWTHIAFIHFL